MATKNQIVKAEAQIIPAVDPASLGVALSELSDELAVVPEWKARAESMVVDSPAAYKAAGDFRATVRSQRKVPRFKLESFQAVVDRARDFLKDKRQDAEKQFDAIDKTLTDKMDAQATRERVAAEAEQKRINEEKRLREEKEAAERRRAADNQAEIERKQRAREIEEARKAGEVKASEAKRLQKEADEKAARDKAAAAQEQQAARENFQPVEVRPNLPAIAGSRRHRNFYADYIKVDNKSTGFDLLLQAYVDTFQSKDPNGSLERRAHLRKFIMEDQQALGKFTRDTQDSAKVMELLPGMVKAWDRDRT